MKLKDILLKINKSSVIKNFSVLSITNLLIQLLSILSSIRIARCLEPSGYGLYNLVFVQASLLGIFSAFGLRLVVIRMISRNTGLSNGLLKISLKIKFISTIVTIIIAVAYNYFNPKNQFSSFLIYLLLLQIIGAAVWDTVESIAFGNQKMQASGVINLIFTVLWVLLIYIVPKQMITVNLMVLFQVCSQILKSLFYYLWLNKTVVDNSPNIDTELNLSNILRQSFPYLILAIFTAIQNQIPVLFLDYNSSLHEVGIFNLGYRILGPLQMILNMALTALFPNLSSLVLKDPTKFDKNVKKVLLMLILIGISGSLTFTIFSKEAINLLYGAKFISASKIVSIQCWFTVLFSIFCLIGTVLSAMDKQKLLAWLSFSYALISTPILWFGSKYGAVGLSVGFLISAVVNMIYHWVIFSKIMPKKISLGFTIALTAILVLGIFIVFKIPQTIDLGYKILVFLITIASLFMLSKVIVKKDILSIT